MMDDEHMIKWSAVVCTNCAHVLDILKNQEEPLYIDKKCSCGHMGFTTIKLNIKCILEEPKGRKPDFEHDGEKWYITEK